MQSLVATYRERVPIEPLPGAVCQQRVRCGKPNCRCSRGELHVAFYRFWREGGRLRKAYVRRIDLETTRAACAKWREQRERIASLGHTVDEMSRARGMSPRTSFLDHMLRKMVKIW
jgi:hypothetical protein